MQREWSIRWKAENINEAVTQEFKSLKDSLKINMNVLGLEKNERVFDDSSHSLRGQLKQLMLNIIKIWIQMPQGCKGNRNIT